MALNTCMYSWKSVAWVVAFSGLLSACGRANSSLPLSPSNASTPQLPSFGAGQRLSNQNAPLLGASGADASYLYVETETPVAYPIFEFEINSGSKKGPRAPICAWEPTYNQSGTNVDPGGRSISVDRSGHVWIPSAVLDAPPAGQGSTYEFAANCGTVEGTWYTPPFTIPDSIGFGLRSAKYISFSEHAAASGFYATGSGIAEFLGNKHYPDRYLFVPRRLLGHAIFPGPVVGDSSGNIFALFQSDVDSPNHVFEFVRGRGSAVELRLKDLPEVHGIEGTTNPDPSRFFFDAKDDFLLPSGQHLLVWKPPYDAKPVRRIPLRRRSYSCTLNVENSLLACGVAPLPGASVQTPEVDFYSYPSGTYLYAIRGFKDGLDANAYVVSVTFVQSPATHTSQVKER